MDTTWHEWRSRKTADQIEANTDDTLVVYNDTATPDIEGHGCAITSADGAIFLGTVHTVHNWLHDYHGNGCPECEVMTRKSHMHISLA